MTDVEDGSTKLIDGKVFAYDAESKEYIPLAKWEEKKYGAAIFRSAQAENCYFDIYSADCFPSMLVMFDIGSATNTDKYLDLWMDRDVTFWYWVVEWPFYLINWLLIIPVLVIYGESALPPMDKKTYETDEMNAWTAFWYSMLSRDTQISIGFY